MEVRRGAGHQRAAVLAAEAAREYARQSHARNAATVVRLASSGTDFPTSFPRDGTPMVNSLQMDMFHSVMRGLENRYGRFRPSRVRIPPSPLASLAQQCAQVGHRPQVLQLVGIDD